MSLYAEWLERAYNKDGSANKKIWDVYLPQEQRIYQYIIGEKVDNISGTIKELSLRFTMTEQYICGFVDGINEVLPEPYDMETLESTTHVSLNINLEKLYRKMVDYKAEHLYKLPEWKSVFSEEKLERIFWEERKSAVYTRPAPKVGRNDPCPCGSGKKYKKCCVTN